VGGALVYAAGWHAVFWVNVPVCAAAVAIAAAAVRESRDAGLRSVDAVGAALVTVGLAAVVAGLTRTTAHGWTSAPTLVLLGAGAVALIAFAVHERRTPEPLLPPYLVRDRRFAAATAVIALASFALLGVIWFVALYLQNVRGYDAIGAGLRTLPLTATTLLIAPAAGRLAPRLGAHRLVVAGMLLTAAALLGLTRISADSGYGVLAASLLVLGAGVALVLPAMAAVALVRVPPERAGIASGVATTARQLGGALGIAVLASLGARLAIGRFHQLAPDPGSAVDELVGGGRVRAVGQLAGRHAHDAATTAFMHGMTTAIWIALAALALVVPVALLGRGAAAGRSEVALARATADPIAGQAR